MGLRYLEFGDSVQIGTAVTGTVAADVAAVDVSTARRGGTHSHHALIQIVRATGTGDVTLPGPVTLIGTCRGRRVLLGALNAGDDIVVGANGGYQELVNAIGLCTALVLRPSGAVSGGGTPAYDAHVIAVWEGGG